MLLSCFTTSRPSEYPHSTSVIMETFRDRLPARWIGWVHHAIPRSAISINSLSTTPLPMTLMPNDSGEKLSTRSRLAGRLFSPCRRLPSSGTFRLTYARLVSQTLWTHRSDFYLRCTVGFVQLLTACSNVLFRTVVLSAFILVWGSFVSGTYYIGRRDKFLSPRWMNNWKKVNATRPFLHSCSLNIWASAGHV